MDIGNYISISCLFDFSENTCVTLKITIGSSASGCPGGTPLNDMCFDKNKLMDIISNGNEIIVNMSSWDCIPYVPTKRNVSSN